MRNKFLMLWMLVIHSFFGFSSQIIGQEPCTELKPIYYFTPGQQTITLNFSPECLNVTVPSHYSCPKWLDGDNQVINGPNEDFIKEIPAVNGASYRFIIVGSDGNFIIDHEFTTQEEGNTCRTSQDLIASTLTDNQFDNYDHLSVNISNNTNYSNLNTSYGITLTHNNPNFDYRNVEAENPNHSFNYNREATFDFTGELDAFISDIKSEGSWNVKIHYINDDNVCDFGILLNDSPFSSTTNYAEQIFILDFANSVPRVFYKTQITDPGIITAAPQTQENISPLGIGNWGKKIIRWFFKRASTNPTTVILGVATDYAGSALFEYWFNQEQNDDYFDALYNVIKQKGFSGLALSVSTNIINSPIGNFVGAVCEYLIETNPDQWTISGMFTGAAIGTIFDAIPVVKNKFNDIGPLLGDLFGDAGIDLSAELISDRRLIKAWQASKDAITDGFPKIRKHTPSLKKIANVLDDTEFLNKLPQPPSPTETIEKILKAVKNPLDDGTGSKLVKLADHLENIRVVVKSQNNLEGESLNRLLTDLKNSNFSMQDGITHMLNVIKDFSPNSIRRFDYSFDGDGVVCTRCKFDVELFNGTPRLIEFKSWKLENIPNLSTRQLTEYFRGASSLDEIMYVFNKLKTPNARDVKLKFQQIFTNEVKMNEIFNSLGDPAKFRQLFGVSNVTDFINGPALNIDGANSIYRFIDIN